MEIHNLKKACRTCLNKTEGGTSIFQSYGKDEIKFSEILQSCTGIIVSNDDGYPDTICSSCATELPSAWKFVVMCRSSSEILQRYVSGLVSVKVEIKEEYNQPFVKADDYDDSDDAFDDSHDVDFKLETAEDLKVALKQFAARKPGRRHRGKGKKTKVKTLEYQCPLCDHASETSCRMKKHFKKSHPQDMDLICKYICEHCEKTFKRKSDIIVHLRIHTGEKPFVCDLCPKKFAQSGTLIEHVRRHTGDMPYKCPSCPKYFAVRSSLSRHSVVHSNIRAFSCEQCGKTFSLSTTLNQHLLVHTEERKHSCSVCGSRMKSINALKIHMSIHQGSHYVCEKCGKKFTGKSNLRHHKNKMHSNISGRCLVCKKDTSNLEEHMKMHANVYQYKCGMCSKSFRVKGALSCHMTVHTNSHKYRCEVQGCDKGFTKYNLLDFHTRKIHSNESFTECQYCSKSFYRKSDLSRHVNTLHPEEKNDILTFKQEIN